MADISKININGTSYNINSNYANSAGTASNANTLNSQGRRTCITENRGTSGLTHYYVYNNGYPTTYGNVLHIGGEGAGELLMGWSGSNGYEHLYYRNARDCGSPIWSDWVTVIDSSNIGSQSVNYATTSSKVVTSSGVELY